ncbi:non-ribosomal peptide synthetase [Thermoactinomyces sp. DSM 45892]|uniref:non-ribosomal peptide synthetase n=1 Tax=Thermoactinomyces sp. DSM 45892 TaxID=1882753 RepID=UPI0008942B40|nr:non-ribosomal peptide synthetase [Thermoactinomyces sp. DSM 45892]SDY17809.1 fengycin family lipopeptide synthetase D/tyrocidine synthetase-3 [Thermoactinomyces sp. DSM 45892]
MSNIERYESSSAQRRLYLIHQYQTMSTAYNLPLVMMVEGKFDKVRFNEAVNKLIQRHESLRTGFVEEKGEVLQQVYESIDMTVIDRGMIEEEDIDKLVHSFIRPFDLQKVPLLRVELADLSPKKHVLMMDIHHIVADGTSIRTMLEEILAFYNGMDLPELDVQYVDFAIWQNDFFQSEEIKAQEEYWMSTFAEEVPVLQLPLDYPRPPVLTFTGDRHSFTLDAALTAQIQDFARREGVTLYMFLLAVYNLLLAKYSGQESIVVGSPIAGRKHVEFERIVGMFVNTLAMRNEPKSDKTFRAFLQEVKTNALKAYDNQDFQFEELIERLGITRDRSRHPLFDTMLVVQNTDKSAIEFAGLSFTPYELENKTAKFDLFVEVFDHEQELEFHLQYNTGLFREETVKQLATHLKHIMQHVLSHPEKKLWEFELITEEEKQQLLTVGSGYKLDSPTDKTITQLFEEYVAKTPDHIALVYGQRKLTYRELNERANRLARTIREKGIQSDSFVGIMADRSVDMLVAIYAVLKAGAAYVPLDPDLPTERIVYILDDSKTHVLVTQEKYRGNLDFVGETLYLEDESLYQNDGSDLEPINTSQSIANVIYTSGSTGNPKGVMIEHHSIVNLLCALQDQYPFGETDAYLLKTTFSFDVSVAELFGWFFGGRLIILEQGLEKDPFCMLRAIDQYQVTYLNLVPSMLSILLDTITEDKLAMLNKLKYLFVAGEAITQPVIHKFYQLTDTVQLINLYGPTEMTVYATGYPLSKDEDHIHVPIGKPLANMEAYIVNSHSQLQPVGVIGELCLAGRGIARGYLNKPELTDKAFIDHPYKPGAKMYRTGDIARWLPCGNIQFYGRMDHQVKIRGYRIELGEIETKLLEHPAIQKAVVVAHKNERGDSSLCSYLVSDGTWTLSELRQYLAKSLPDYMIPSYCMELEELPLTPNGKLDKRALPDPTIENQIHKKYIAPTNKEEMAIAEIFQEILGVERVGLDDHFFELGGHSLKATMLILHVHKKLEVELPMRVVFNHPTVKEIAEYIRGAETHDYASIQPIEKQPHYAVSSAQKRMYIMSEMAPESTAFNITSTMVIQGDLDYGWFQNIFNELVQRHESLRTSFDLVDGEPVQLIQDEVVFKLEVMEAKWENANQWIKRFIRPFDLKKGPLIRVGLIKVEPTVHLFTIDMHHIISDGTSIGILIKEFIRLCRGESLSPLRIQYKDFSAWQNEALQSEMTKAQETYWLEQFKGDIPVLQLPTDYPRSESVDHKGNSVMFQVSKEQADLLYQFSRENETTLFILLLAAYNILLYKYTAQEDIIVGTPIAGRQHIDLENVVGMFVNTLPIRNRPVGSKTIREFITDVKNQVFAAYENQGYPLEELVFQLGIDREANRNPLFDTMLVVQNMEIPEIKVDHLQFQPYEEESYTSQGALTWAAIEGDEGLSLVVEYQVSLFKQETIELMGQDFLTVLQKMIENLDETIMELSIREKQETDQSDALSALDEEFAF